MSSFILELAKRLGLFGGVVSASAVLLTYLLWPPAAARIVNKKPVKAGDKTLVKYDKGPFAVTMADGEATIRLAAEGIGSKATEPTTIPEVFRLAAERKGDKIAMRVESPVPPLDGKKAPPPVPLDQWKSWTYSQYYAETRQAAKAMIALGFAAFDSCNIWGFNSPEWFLGDLGAILAGGKAAGIYPTDTKDQVAFKCRHSASSIALIEDNAKLKNFVDLADELPDLKALVVWSEEPSLSTISRKDGTEIVVLGWAGFMDKGAGGDDAELDKRIAAQKPGPCCTLIYTSGTTGNPKAVMISHDNIIFEARCVASEMPMVGNDGTEERIISYLPLSHVAGMMVDIITPLSIACYQSGWVSSNFARPYDLKVGTIGDRLKCVQPTIFLGVPRVWEKIAEKMKAIGKSTKGLKLKIAAWSKAKGLAHARATNLPGYSPDWADEGVTTGTGSYPWGYTVANKLVLSKVKEALGLQKCKFGFTGAAPITVQTLEYFGALGIQVNEVYGMSECTGATSWSKDETHLWGSCGYAMEGTEVAIFQVDEATGKKTMCPYAANLFQPTETEQGEICYRGRHIMMGYLAQPKLGAEHVAEIEKKTAESIDDEGWLHSGDKGCMSAGGMIRITGRFKELIIGAGGENIAPVPIEDNIKALCPAISNVMMVGDKRKYNTCLVTLKAVGATGDLPGTDELDGPALEIPGLDPKVTTISAAMTDPVVRKHIHDAIVATNKNPKVCVNNASAIQKFEILPCDFSVQGDELTATLKLKRSVAEQKWLEYIEKMY